MRLHCTAYNILSLPWLKHSPNRVWTFAFLEGARQLSTLPFYGVHPERRTFQCEMGPFSLSMSPGPGWDHLVPGILRDWLKVQGWLSVYLLPWVISAAASAASPLSQECRSWRDPDAFSGTRFPPFLLFFPAWLLSVSSVPRGNAWSSFRVSRDCNQLMPSF